MKKTFVARRVPRKVGQDEDDEAASAPPNSDSAVRRPTTRLRKSTSLRNSLGPSTLDDDEDSEASVITPKRSTLSRVAIQRNASKRSSLHPSQLPTRQVEDQDEGPSYNAASLRELKESTPTTPGEFRTTDSSEIDDAANQTRAMDLSSKFGSSLARYQDPSMSSAIPSATEIAEKKARRARLAKEQQAEEYISLDPDDPDLDDDDNMMKDENGRLVLKPKDKYGLSESRLVRDDEDIMENFDEFTEDGRISLGRKAEAEATRKRKQDMAAQIAEAEGVSDSDSGASDHERNAAFEAAQTKHGTYARNTTDPDPADARPKTPPVITPLPPLDSVIEHLRQQLADMQTSRMQKLKEMENLQREKIRLAEEEVRIQRALKETAEKFEDLRIEKGIVKKEASPAMEAAPAFGLQGTGVGKQGEAIDAGTSPDGTNQEAEDEEDVEDDEDEEIDRPGFMGLGFDGTSRGLGFGLGLGQPGATSNSDDEMST